MNDTWAAAFDALLTAVGIAPASADMATRRVIHDAALAYARASGLGEARREEPSVSGGFTFRFGSCKGKGLHDVDVKDLRFYERCAAQALDNPEKERFRANNQRDLDAIRGELRRRGEAADY